MPVKKNPELPRGIYQIDNKGKMFGIQYTDASGRRRREKAGTYRMAENLLLERHLERLKHKLPNNRHKYGVKIGELVTDASDYAYSNNDPKSAHDLRLKLERIRQTFGDMDASTITRQQITDWLDAEAALRGWRPASRNRYQAAWSMMFRVGMENRKIDWNPAQGIKNRREDNVRVRFLSRDEEERLSKAIEEKAGEICLAAFVLSVHTGMRLSEQERARVGDYDATTGMLTVHQTKNRRGSPVRYVPLTPIAVQAYSKLCEGKNPGDLICETQMKRIPQWFDMCVKAAEVADYTWHCNRHTFATRLVMSGVPIAAVAQLAGHSNISMTMRYAHLAPRSADQAVAGMMSWYGNAA